MKPGEDMGASYKVDDLASLFSVCALALESLPEWNDEIQDRLRQDIKHVLELGARLAEAATDDVSNLSGGGS